MKCKEIMTEDPACCLPGDTVDQAAQLMKDVIRHGKVT
jgi:CBS domain-containing protein